MEGKLAEDGHLSTDTIIRYVQGDTEPLQDSEVQLHLTTCSLCSDLIRDLGKLLETRKATA